MAKQRSPRKFPELRKKAEKLIAENGGKVPRISYKKDLQGLSHELSLYHIELEMQNDELRRSQEKLEESRSRYVDLYEYAPVGYLTFDEKGVVLDLNLTAAHLLGLDRTFLLNKPFSPLAAPESQDAFYLHRREALRSPGTHTCELMLRRNRGQEHFLARLESVAAQSNGAAVIRTVLTDITERKQALETRSQELEKKVKERTADVEELQKRLEEAEQIIEAIRRGDVDAVVVGSGEEGSRIYTLEGPDHPYRNIVETMNAGAVTINEQGIIFYSNGAFSNMTGIPLQTLLGSSFKDLLVPEDLPLFLDFVKKAREADKTTGEVAIRSDKGKLFVRLAGSSRTAYGIETTCIVITDISALKSAEESSRKEAMQAKRERDRLMTLIDSMNEGVWFTHADGRIVLANSVAKSQAAEVGIDPDALLQSQWSSLLPQIDMFAPGGTSLQMKPFLRVFRGKPFHGAEIALRNRTTGEVFYRRISANPIFDSGKRVEGVITVVQDITAEKRATDEKAQLEERLRQSQKMEAIGTLAGGIAHDFNNMLAVIMGNAELALDDAEGNHGVKRNIEQIVKASKRARDLIKQILTFSRKTAAGKNPLNLTPLIKETHKLLRGSLPSTITIGLDIETESDTVTADPTQIQQILVNLATNAAYAMHDKGILTIGLSNVTLQQGGPLPDPEMPSGTYVKLTVRDTGKGMSDKIKRRIFEPFFTTKPSGQGTGMGLAVVYGIVKSHGGAITVESEPGKGSNFTVFLPHAGEQAEEEAKVRGRMPYGKERVLLVDDEEFVIEMTSQMLMNLGYEVTTARNGSEALKMFLDRPSGFDLVITDQTMPGITGVDLAEKMLEAREDFPIILFTGYSETVSPEKAKAAGIREFVMKPFTKREIAKTVRRVLDAEKKRAE
jgi:PAS domain S-box-containing protein